MAQMMLRNLLGLMALLMPLWVLGQGAPLALVTDSVGQVQRVGSGALQLLEELPAGTLLDLAPQARATLVYLKSGEEYAITGPARVELQVEAPVVDGRPMAGKALLIAAGDGLSTATLAQPAVVMRAPEEPDNPLTLGYPAGSKIIETQPTLQWQLEGSGYRFRVELLSEDGRSLYLTETGESSLTLPAEVVLPRGQLLSWEVEASRGVQTLYGAADFWVVSAEVSAQAAALIPPEGAPFARRLLYARQLEGLGLFYAAHRIWAELAKERPDDVILQEKESEWALRGVRG